MLCNQIILLKSVYGILKHVKSIITSLILFLYIIQYRQMEKQQEGLGGLSIGNIYNFLVNEDSQSIINEGQGQKAKQKEKMLRYKFQNERHQICSQNHLNIQDAQRFFEIATAQINKNCPQTFPKLSQDTIKCARDIVSFQYYTFGFEEMKMESQSSNLDEDFEIGLKTKLDCQSQRQQFINVCLEQSKKQEYPTFQDYQVSVLDFLKSRDLTMCSIRKILRDKLRNKLVYQTYIRNLKHQCNCKKQDCSQPLDMISLIYQEKLDLLSTIFSESKNTITKSFLEELYPIIFDRLYIQKNTPKRQEEELNDNSIQ